MHMRTDNRVSGPKVVPVTFELEDPLSLTGDPTKRHVELKAAVGESILELAMDNGISIEHTCGGVCACSTCHVYIEQGEELFNEPEDEELDRVEEAPGIQLNSRLSCQARVQRTGEVKVRVPAWNRNAVKEIPH